ncbi:MAG: excinuclease ABC subunit UvrC [Treponemataceae bacterium]
MSDDKAPSNYHRLKTVAKEAPLSPGVYIMRGEDGTVIYVGKARVLRNRLSSYFSGEKDVKTRTLLKRARSIEHISTNNEYEALLLENTLIKQHSPKYNINLKDGKSYPVIRITNEPFPKIFRTRRIIEDGSLYYGPFPNVQAVDLMLELIDKLYPLRKCRRLRPRKAPCMYYHIGRCSAPCAGKITEAEYAVHVERVKLVLGGETAALKKDLGARMAEAASDMKFELAAQLRDAIRAIEDLSAENAVVDFDPDARDYVSWATEGVLATFTVFSLRGGKMTGRELYRAQSASTEEESLESFLVGYYGPDRLPPPRVFLSGSGHDLTEIERWCREELKTEPAFLSAYEKRHEVVLSMAYQNAKEDLAKRLKERGAGPALDELQRALSLSRRPERIEGFDIAQLDGKHTVASLVSFKDGIPDKKNYRHFRIRSVEGMIDDFQSMREAVTRRYSRLLADEAELPDLILIDGGIGQVNAAKGVLDALGADLELVGLAKRDEELWLPNAKEPIRLPKTSEALKVLQFVRDETHRFATGHNQKLRAKALSLEGLESVAGIGPSRAAALIKEFGSLEAIAAAAPEELSDRCGIPSSVAAAAAAAARVALTDRARERERLEANRKGANTGERRAAYRNRASVSSSVADLAAEALTEYEIDKKLKTTNNK